MEATENATGIALVDIRNRFWQGRILYSSLHKNFDGSEPSERGERVVKRILGSVRFGSGRLA